MVLFVRAPRDGARERTEEITGKFDPAELLLPDPPAANVVDVLFGRSRVLVEGWALLGIEGRGAVVVNMLLTEGELVVETVPRTPTLAAAAMVLRIRFGSPVGTGVFVAGSAGSELWTVNGGLLNWLWKDMTH